MWMREATIVPEAGGPLVNRIQIPHILYQLLSIAVHMIQGSEIGVWSMVVWSIYWYHVLGLNSYWDGLVAP